MIKSIYATMAKETTTGWGFPAKINANGTVTVPAWVRNLVGKKCGDTIDVIIPKNQSGRKT